MPIRFLLLAGLGLGSTLAAASVLLDRVPPPAGPPLVCPALAPRIETADRIELVHGGEAFWLERRGQLWSLVRQGGYPARHGMADLLLSAVMTARLIKPVVDPAGLDDPFGTEGETGTLVRVLAQSGAVLCAVVLGPPPAPVLRRQGDPAAWVADTLVPAPGNPRAWSQAALPVLEPAQIVQDSAGSDAGGLRRALAAGLPFDDADAAPHHRATPQRTVLLATDSGPVVLSTGWDGGQLWLSVAGRSAWAAKLTPYVFALPSDSPLALP